ncbi:MAG: hypothetical protein DRI37_04140 [Chloroflexi bacterium]|nr:MAG: hypothetical protein DRI37_04140 [Chloroflexota bacterium]
MAKKKVILDRTVDAVTTRDEKEAAGAKARLVREAVQKRVAEAKAKAAEAKEKAAEARAKAAEKAAAGVEAKSARRERERQMQERAEAKRHIKAKSRVYVVKSGDSLSKIAKEVLGDASRWPEIFEANKDKIKDPNRIHPGQELRIP